MSDNTNHVAPQPYLPYQQSMHLAAASHPQNSGLAMNKHKSFPSISALQASLPSSGHDLGKKHCPLMVMPSGQTVPISALYGAHAGTGNMGLSYLPDQMVNNFVGNTAGYGTAPLSQYQWPYGMHHPVSEAELSTRGQWANNNENSRIPNGMTSPQQGYHGPYAFTHPATSGGQHYIAGPIQPMKSPDNKSYELINLDDLVSLEPGIPRAVPALWTNQEDLTLAKCLQNPEGITNVYIRGFMPNTSDQDLDGWASRFGEIESCKAIIDQDTGNCKGFGFVMYYSPAAAENCIRGFFHLGFQASYAQKSRNSRLKDLEDKTSTNIYCTGVPIDWNESDLAKHFLPYNAISTKVCRDSPSGVSKEVGFARFETREIAERVIKEFHSTLNEHNKVKLYLRFADTKAQKQLKQQSQERRQWRSREYSYSVEHTPSPATGRTTQISPAGSYQSPAGVGNNFTPATSVSPPDGPMTNKETLKQFVKDNRHNSWPTSGSLQSIGNSHHSSNVTTDDCADDEVNAAVKVKASNSNALLNRTPSPKTVTIKVEQAGGKENC